MRTLNIGLMAALAVGALLFCSNVSYAQDAKEGGKKRGFSPQQRIEQMDKELKLTSAQKTKLTALFEDQAKKRQELQGLSQDERRQKGREAMQDTEKKLKEILTPEQWEKWQKMRQEQKGKNGERRGKKGA